MTEVGDPGAEEGPDPREVEAAWLRFRAQLRAGEVSTLEQFLAELPEGLHQELRDLAQQVAAIEEEVGAPPGDVPVKELLEQGADLGPTVSMSMIGSETGGQAQDADALLDELAAEAGFASRYEIDRRIEGGGFGDIMRVWDRRLKRILAMKIMKLPARAQDSPEERARALWRFHSEALVTAQLDHPGILPVHDIGVESKGLVYFTMKYVRGRRNLRRIFEMVARGEDGWSVNRAVGAILRVCEAVAYAHSKKVLHRDIKPANIMVGQYGETYLLDWGLARRLDQPDPPLAEGSLPALVAEHGAEASLSPEVVAAAAREVGEGEGPDPSQFLEVESWLFSRDGKVMGTPPYMSPEQARGEVARVDERSDIYSLGAILYHLLTGRTPYVEPGERPFPFVVLMRVQAGAPQPIAELTSDAPPSLVEICERAMAREPAARFARASDMARALEDYLEDISEAREEARLQAQRANKINELLVQMLSSADPRQALGRDLTVLQVLDRFSGRIEEGIGGSPLDEAALRRTIGGVYKELGRHEPARRHLEAALSLYDDILGYDHRETLAAGTDLAVLQRVMGNLDASERLLEEIRDIQTESLGAEHLDTLRTLVVLAETLRRSRQGRLDEVQDLLQRVLDGRSAQLGGEHLETLTAMNRLAMVKWDIDRSDADAEELLRDALAGLHQFGGERHPETLSAMSDLASMLQHAGQLEEAEALQRTSLAGQREVLGEDHLETIMSLANLGWLLKRRGKLEEAEELLARAVQQQRRVMGEDSHELAVYRNNLALTLQMQGRPEQAAALLDDVVQRAGRSNDGPNWHVARFQHNLASCLIDLGQRERPRALLREALAVLREVLGVEHVLTRETSAALESLGREGQAS